MWVTVLEVTGFIAGLSTLLVLLDHLEPHAAPGVPAEVRPPVAQQCTRAARRHARVGRPGPGACTRVCPHRDRLARARRGRTTPWRCNGARSRV